MTEEAFCPPPFFWGVIIIQRFTLSSPNMFFFRADQMAFLIKKTFPPFFNCSFNETADTRENRDFPVPGPFFLAYEIYIIIDSSDRPPCGVMRCHFSWRIAIYNGERNVHFGRSRIHRGIPPGGLPENFRSLFMLLEKFSICSLFIRVPARQVPPRNSLRTPAFRSRQKNFLFQYGDTIFFPLLSRGLLTETAPENVFLALSGFDRRRSCPLVALASGLWPFRIPC